MNKNQIFAMVAFVSMSCLIFAQGPARDPKTGRFIKKSMMTSKMPASKMSKSAFAAVHPRDPKTGRFIKKSTMPMHTMMPTHTKHSMPMRNSKTGRFMKSAPSTMKSRMSHPMMKIMPKKPAAKTGMMSKMKSMFHKPKK